MESRSRKDLLWADLNPAGGHERAGRRPVLVLRNNLFNRKCGTVNAMAITSHTPAAGFPLTLPLDPAETGLPKQSWLMISQVRTISTERLGRRIGRVPEEQIAEAVEGLLELIR